MDIQVLAQTTHLYMGGKTQSLADLAQQPVVVFIHGAQQDHSCWVLQSRWFAYHGFSVLAPDLPGHGRSAGAALPSVEQLAEWIVALLDAVGVERATLVGHSMGSLVALEAAARFPQRVDRAVLIGASLPMPVAPLLLDLCRDDEPKAAALINAWSYSPTAQLGGSPVPGLWLVGTNRQLMARQRPGVLFRDMSACNAYARRPDSLADLAVPVLIVAGSADRMTPPKAAKALLEYMPHARLVTIAGSGHALMAEKPDAVLDALREFIAA